MNCNTVKNIIKELEYATFTSKKSCEKVLDYLDTESIYVSYVSDTEEGIIYLIAEGLMTKSTTCMFIIHIDDSNIRYVYKLGKLRKYNSYKMKGTTDISQLKSVFDYLLYRE